MSLEARLTVLSGLVVLFACDRGGSSPPPLEAVVEVALGGFHSCARTHDGSVFCWGMNHRGQAGRPPLDATQPRPARVHGLAGVQQLGLGDAHSCALRTDGAVLCWGDNGSGQLGDGTTVSRDQPRAVPGLTGVVELSLGSGKTCVRTADESVLCFGQTHGGGRAHSTAPVAMPALAGAAQLAVGMTHSCAKMGDGTVRCWGSNFRGQLGDGTTVDHLEPMPVPGLTGVEQVAVGAFSSCARMLDETVRCWGYNGLGALGLDPSQEVVATPTQVPSLANVAHVAMGEFHRCVRRTDGLVLCWGGRYWSQIGDGVGGGDAEALAPQPVLLRTLPPVEQLAVGQRHSCGLLPGGALRCWGYNVGGGLGDGTREDRATPVAVR